MRKWEAEKG